ncbi:hypothetical protein E2C01_050265 [Portunus trituberculatus]|uniref:Uncharacterized protein n=1 Tax=Portunus trituberculatus TaxID=210409 RepID=A0A5B7GG23_PORTR|nr:hypothetical protein [Portunus trituberculatus]
MFRLHEHGLSSTSTCIMRRSKRHGSVGYSLVTDFALKWLEVTGAGTLPEYNSEHGRADALADVIERQEDADY